jgi:V8-like Glu-specific endopeptidase
MTRRTASPSLALALIFIAGLAACATEVGEPFAGTSAEIAGGTYEPGYDGVVSVLNSALGGLCTGTLIAPRVVLTAKHCVQESGPVAPADPSAFSVGIGPSALRPTASYRVITVRTTPGSYTESLSGLTGIDIAVLTLERAVAGVTPYEIRRDRPSDARGQTVTVVGYGQIPSGAAGTKYRGTTAVTGLAGDVIYSGSAICQGDSGGPMFDSLGRVFGVASFGNGACGSGYNGHNTVSFAASLELIDAALAEAICRNDGPEVCDGGDNDCNGQIDETCSPLGSLCTASDQCQGTNCAVTSAGQICTQSCDPLRPYAGCPASMYCSADPAGGCGGFCVAGSGPASGVAKGNGEPCGADTECNSLVCRNPGDGVRRCLEPCRGDAGMCLAGEACAAGAGGCAVCVAEQQLIIPRGLGEGCTADAACASGRCFDDLGVRYCTRDCASDADCPNSFHCRADACVRGERDGTGTTCAPAANDDCNEGMVCASEAGRNWCTQLDCATAGNECPSGFDCVPVGGTTVCRPMVRLLGETCAADAECLSGMCRAGECTRTCSVDTPCGVGLECRHATDGTGAYCQRPASPPPDDGGGCGISSPNPADHGTASMTLVAGLLGLLVARRRRSAS